MAILIVLLICVLIGAVVLLVGAPLRRAASSGEDGAAGPGPDRPDPRARRDELEAAREAKYREIRDTELDFRTGKLSEQDYRALDSELRAEALRILDSIEALDPGADPPAGED